MPFFDKRRILLVCNSLAVYAGVEKRTFELAKALKAGGFSVALLTLRITGKITALYQAENIPVSCIPVYRYTDRIGFSLRNFLRLIVFLWQKRFGIIVGVQPPAHYFCRLAAFPRFGRRLFAMERVTLAGRSWKWRWLDWLLQFWTTKIICVSDLLQEQLIQKSHVANSRIIVIPHGVELAPEAQPDSSFQKMLGGNFVFGYVGLLEERKRVHILLRAFASLGKTYPALRLLIVGDGPQRQALEKLAADLGVQDKIIFVGEQADADAFYPLMDVFVFPSVIEGLGTVCFEAMVHRLPVIAADTRPMCDYIHHEKTGILFPPDDISALQSAMLRLYQDADLRKRLGIAGRQLVETNFNRAKNLAQLIACLAGNNYSTTRHDHPKNASFPISAA